MPRRRLTADAPSDAGRACHPTSGPTWPDERLLDLRICQLGVTIEGSVLEARIAELQRELDARGLTLQAALLAVGGMVLARRRARRRDSVLPRASRASSSSNARRCSRSKAARRSGA